MSTRLKPFVNFSVIIDGQAIDFDGRRRTFELEHRTEPIPIDSITPELDPRWTFTDAAGHFHAVRDGNAYNRLPTLKEIKEGEPYRCDEWGCDEIHQDTFLVCAICEERIEPGSRVPMRSYISGPETWRIKMKGDAELGRGWEQGQALSVRLDNDKVAGNFGIFYVDQRRYESTMGLGRDKVTFHLSGWMAVRAR